MKWFKGIIIVILAFILTLLDVAFFSSLPIYGATIVSTFIVSIVFALEDDWPSIIIYTSSAILFFSVFSSLPTMALIFVFYCIPLLVHYSKNNYFNEPSAFLSIAYFVPAMLLFELALIIATKQWAVEAILSVCYFVIINAALGVLIYIPVQRVRNIFMLNGKIKI